MLNLVKDVIRKCGGVQKVSMCRGLLKSVKDAHAKSIIAARLEQEKQEEAERKKAEDARKEKELQEENTLDLQIRLINMH